ncbi:MAG: PEFG-CTERM sorting domain-containing protein [Nitrosopumilaceae archaeon]|nr:PEFG-CTERM sorting domain-containing protein [Nitrosopumilaceae archaeon]NIU02604.1 PEFG-CTERM sorting domain-containing protein [Nitrosopumilaceae archaeon]NIU89067.1 PEFG-CTERM sorting domain-containing protein [Nitrosopumilaceae archaeon]NIV67170.1 PEFG-CTERM sorting domain-containing protein [Nitrosopumilaceae archaeon]NIX63205.1 PEFG-CTERM sorting domain-containing protein [Nitrosopumilaceae archaeon]
MKIFFIFTIVSIFTFQSAFSETYDLVIDEKTFTVKYDGMTDVLAMKIDHESKSLLIGIKNTEDSNFRISVPNELISASSNEFAILVNGHELNYSLEEKNDNTIFSFFIPYGTQEIEIIGTKVVPEFPFGPIVIFSVIILSVIAISKTKDIVRL